MLKKHGAKQKEKEEQKSNAQLRKQMTEESMKITEQSAEEVKKKLDWEKNIYVTTVAKRVSLDHNLQELNEQSRAAVDELAQKQKQFEKLKRQYKKLEFSKGN